MNQQEEGDLSQPLGHIVPPHGTNSPTPWDKSKTSSNDEAINSKNR